MYPCFCRFENEHFLCNSGIWLNISNIQLFDRVRDGDGNPSSSGTRAQLDAWTNTYDAYYTFTGLSIVSNVCRKFLDDSTEKAWDAYYRLRLDKGELVGGEYEAGIYLETDQGDTRNECDFDGYAAAEINANFWQRNTPDTGIKHPDDELVFPRVQPASYIHTTHYYYPGEDYAVAWTKYMGAVEPGDSTELFRFNHDEVDDDQTAYAIYLTQDYTWSDNTITWTVDPILQYEFNDPITFGAEDLNNNIVPTWGATFEDRVFFGSGDPGETDERALPAPFNRTSDITDEDIFPERRHTPLMHTDDFMRWRLELIRQNFSLYDLVLISNTSVDRYTTYSDLTLVDSEVCYQNYYTVSGMKHNYSSGQRLTPVRAWDNATKNVDEFSTDLTTFSAINQDYLVRFAAPHDGLYGSYPQTAVATGWALIDSSENELIAVGLFPEEITITRHGYYYYDNEFLTFDINFFAERF